jgi:phage host-nuclease inhibitor protein Gam
MNNTHEDAPVILQTRWVLSYLRGPLTRSQIKLLMDPLKAAQPALAPSISVPMATAAGSVAASSAPSAPTGQRPTLASEIPQFFLPARGRAPGGSTVFYRPTLLGTAKVNLTDVKTRIDMTQDMAFTTPVTDEAIPVAWENAQEINVPASDLEKSPAEGAQFADLPGAAAKAKNYAAWEKDLVTWLYGTCKVELYRSPSAKAVSKPGESERDFRIRLQQATREGRDDQVDKLRKQYAPKVAALQERIRRAQEAVEREKAQASQQKVQTAISMGTTLLGAFMGRKAVSASTLGRATTAARGVSRSMKESQDIGRAEDNVEALQQKLADLNAEFEAQAAELQSSVDPLKEELETITIKPKKANISVQLCALVWAPHWRDAQGALTPAWE